MAATKEQILITVLVFAWVLLTWFQSGFSIAANMEATKWTNSTGTGETPDKPSNWHGSQWMNGIAIFLSILVPALILYLNADVIRKAVGTPAVRVESVLSGGSLTSWT